MSPDDQARLLSAVEALAVSDDPIHRRVENAGLRLLPLQAGDFRNPADGARLEQILRLLTGVGDPTGELGDMKLSTFAMSDPEAVHVARLIFELHQRAG